MTRNDVAKLAGVSTATVSRVFNNVGTVDIELREKVLKAANELNYKPNMIARSLKTKETKQLAFVVEDISNPILGDVIEGFQAEALKNGYMMNLCVANNMFDKYMDSIVSHNIKGIFTGQLSCGFNTEKLLELQKSGISIVVNSTLKLDCERISMLDADFEDGFRQLFKHLISLGHRKIAYLDGFPPDTEYDSRFRLYRSFIHENKLEYSSMQVVFNNYSIKHDFDTGFRLVNELMDRNTGVTAIMCMNDYMALGAMAAIRRRGRRIPEDYSVTGYDNIVFGQVSCPELTTVNIPKYEVGVRAVQLMLDQMKGAACVNEIFPCQLIIRGSTGPAGV